jgi:hypothetical protein
MRNLFGVETIKQYFNNFEVSFLFKNFTNFLGKTEIKNNSKNKSMWLFKSIRF